MKAHGEDITTNIAGYKSYLSDALRFKKAFNEEDSILFAGSKV